MDRLAMYHHLNSQVLWCQNNRESLLMIDPKMGAGSSAFLHDYNWYHLRGAGQYRYNSLLHILIPLLHFISNN